MTSPELMDAADRLWEATYALDDLRGDTVASEWTAEKVRTLIRAEAAEDSELILRLARALEDRLEREREAAA